MLIKDQSKNEQVLNIRKTRLKKLQDGYQQSIIPNDLTEAKNKLKAVQEKYRNFVFSGFNFTII